MHKAVVKSQLKKKGYYEVYFSDIRYTSTGLAVLSIGNVETVYVAADKILKIVWDFKNCPRKN